MFATNTQLREKVQGLEKSLEQSATDLKAAQDELAEALKAKEEVFAAVEAANKRAEQAEADAKAAQDLLTDAQAKVDEAEKAKLEAAKAQETIAAQVNRQVTATVASIGAEPVPQAKEDDTPEDVKKIQSLTGREKLQAIFALKSKIIP